MTMRLSEFRLFSGSDRFRIADPDHLFIYFPNLWDHRALKWNETQQAKGIVLVHYIFCRTFVESDLQKRSDPVVPAFCDYRFSVRPCGSGKDRVVPDGTCRRHE